MNQKQRKFNQPIKSYDESKWLTWMLVLVLVEASMQQCKWHLNFLVLVGQCKDDKRNSDNEVRRQ